MMKPNTKECNEHVASSSLPLHHNYLKKNGNNDSLPINVKIQVFGGRIWILFPNCSPLRLLCSSTKIIRDLKRQYQACARHVNKTTSTRTNFSNSSINSANDDIDSFSATKTQSRKDAPRNFKFVSVYNSEMKPPSLHKNNVERNYANSANPSTMYCHDDYLYVSHGFSIQRFHKSSPFIPCLVVQDNVGSNGGDSNSMQIKKMTVDDTKIICSFTPYTNSFGVCGGSGVTNPIIKIIPMDVYSKRGKAYPSMYIHQKYNHFGRSRGRTVRHNVQNIMTCGRLLAVLYTFEREAVEEGGGLSIDGDIIVFDLLKRETK